MNKNLKTALELVNVFEQRVQHIMGVFLQDAREFRSELTSGINVHRFRSSLISSITGSFIRSKGGDVLVINVTASVRGGVLELEADVGVDGSETSEQILLGPRTDVLLHSGMDAALGQVQKWLKEFETFLTMQKGTIFSEIDRLM